eukprot:71809-Chlamydomonas_euryale.AAC.3
MDSCTLRYTAGFLRLMQRKIKFVREPCSAPLYSDVCSALAVTPRPTAYFMTRLSMPTKA